MSSYLRETTQKILFEQAKSSMNSFDSAQDSLDKAYLTIMFGNIAFYATKIKPSTLIYLNLIPIVYMAICLCLILWSFMLSKSMMRIFYNNTLRQILILELNSPDEDEIRLIDQNMQDMNKLNILNYKIEH
ncbi:MAG: hypothetical protein K2P99_06515 [Burkholderiales bacterium]|nr:hypothetical protein [Burkholderiales bacterium]